MNLPKDVLVTGATGFLGTSLVDHLSSNPGVKVKALVRRNGVDFSDSVTQVLVPGDDTFSVELPLQRVQVVIHLAARAHIIKDTCSEPLSQFRLVNVEGTLKLAQQALAAGVKRFIFISSIGVNGSYTSSDDAFTESSMPKPHADYAISKFEAEQALRKLVAGTSMELVVIRPPLVYAGNAPGNFHRLLMLIATGVPLPFGLVRNRRSMVSLENLIDFITLCVDHPAAANELFLISDNVEISTPEMVRYLSEGMGMKARLLPVSSTLIRWLASMVGKQGMYTQLFGSLRIDSSKACKQLGWHPPLAPAEALVKAGRDFKVLQALRG